MRSQSLIFTAADLLLKCFEGRHPMFFLAAGATVMLACVCGGTGLAVWTDTVWPVPCSIAVGVSLLIVGVMNYRRLDEGGKDTAYRYFAALFYAEAGFVFGGMPGAIIGMGVAGKFGETIGYFATAVPISIWNALRGWR